MCQLQTKTSNESNNANLVNGNKMIEIVTCFKNLSMCNRTDSGKIVIYRRGHGLQNLVDKTTSTSMNGLLFQLSDKNCWWQSPALVVTSKSYLWDITDLKTG